MVHFSSTTDLWETPPELFARLDEEFHFTLDVCALPANAQCRRFFSLPHQDGLKQKWSGTCWINPPYGRTIGLWMRKAWEESRRGVTVVCLTPARTDTAWWHDFTVRGEVRFIRGSIKFSNCKNSAPFPSAIIVFRPAPVKCIPATKYARRKHSTTG
jgi:phage N-6-adenine-methyltransferase